MKERVHVEVRWDSAEMGLARFDSIYRIACALALAIDLVQICICSSSLLDLVDE